MYLFKAELNSVLSSSYFVAFCTFQVLFLASGVFFKFLVGISQKQVFNLTFFKSGCRNKIVLSK